VTIDVSVIGCNNLKSVLKRLFARPVDSYVQIKINDQVVCTELVKDEKNPNYDLSSTYAFRIRPSDAGLDNFVTLTVLDRGLMDDSVLGYARVSFAALKASSDAASPTAIILPLSRHLQDIAYVGKGFFNSNNYYLARDSRYTSRASRDSTTSQRNKMVKSAKEMPTISVAISKIDLLTHGMLEALRKADEENAAAAAPGAGGEDLWMV
jgi:hypothetical protein